MFDSSFKFYLLNDRYDYILAVKCLDQNSIEKLRYTLDGVLINHVIDKIKNNKLIRNTNEKEIIIESNKIVSTKQNIKLKAIDKPSIEVLIVENRNIGVIDL